MEPTEKRTVMAIVERNEGKYTPKCLHELFFEAHVLYADMQKLRLCVSAAKDDPDHLNRGMPAEDPGGNVAPEVVAALAAQLPVTHGLATLLDSRAKPSSNTWWPSAHAMEATSGLPRPSRWT